MLLFYDDVKFLSIEVFTLAIGLESPATFVKLFVAGAGVSLLVIWLYPVLDRYLTVFAGSELSLPVRLSVLYLNVRGG